ncbi:YopX family protein [Streptococcus anginosus]|nr:YopX family protein [Streptococcus anginosus]MED5825258.1 YopX family protein [Streptococcus anginosus]MED5853076.1 YopX family protein [Streptococcus anginosus]MED5896266.1 YopX family protein [Streptococcus anginosus]MED5898307.1 YopX family protein [Streptococcus anginosus]
MIPKFRAWDKTHKKLGMIDADMQDGLFQSVKIFDEDGDDWQESENFILMQSTELKDKNGVEIFEGDIVKTTRFLGRSDEVGGFYEYDKEFIGIVKYLEGAWLIDTGNDAVHLWTEIEENEVIGNVYEQPEYLKKRGN